MEPRRFLLSAVVFAVSLAAPGCVRQPEATFELSDDAAELSELHQANIRDGLKRMFGTPTRPRLLSELPVETSDSEEDEDDKDANEADAFKAASEEQSANEQATAQLSFLDTHRLFHGAEVYTKRCSGCHGVQGDGNGAAAAYLRPKPRDYRKGIYKFTSTPYGQRPTRQDLVRTIRRGAKGTSMPAFPWMPQEDVDAVIDYVIYLSLRGQVENGLVYVSEDYDEDEPLDPVEFADALDTEVEKWDQAQAAAVNPISAEPAYDLASIELGRRQYIKSSCYSCHGEDAKGQTEWLSPEFLAAQDSPNNPSKVEINFDAWGDPAPAANITARMLHGGRRPLDIYRRIYTGINGTPMPQFGQVFADDPDAIWHMVHYIMHIVDGGDPTVGISVADVNASEDDPSEAAEEEDSEEVQEAA